LEPVSIGFEHPKRHGYRILFHTLEEHRQALVAPSWKYSLNYETRWMNRQQIVDTAYEAILRLNRLKAKYGIISRKMAEMGEERIQAARTMAHLIDELVAKKNLAELSRLKPRIDEINAFPAVEKLQLELPMGPIKLRFLESLWSWATRR